MALLGSCEGAFTTGTLALWNSSPVYSTGQEFAEGLFKMMASLDSLRALRALWSNGSVVELRS